jgi:hypothetical protein
MFHKHKYLKDTIVTIYWSCLLINPNLFFYFPLENHVWAMRISTPGQNNSFFEWALYLIQARQNKQSVSFFAETIRK